jgi:hypothetical protein
MPSNEQDKATDISDVRQSQSAPNALPVSPMLLPIRGEKRIVPSPVSPANESQTFNQEWSQSGLKSPQDRGYAPTGRTSLVEQQDYFLKAAMTPYVDYVYVRLKHRGVGADRTYDQNTPAVYRFLINPKEVSVNRNTLDLQSFARSGWQIGVWGEDSVQISMSGKTAGQYWSFGITDRYQQFTESYRNLIMLQQVFENNGYFFEGEEAGEGPLAADFTRRRIKMHEDVELTIGNFVWFGMFDTLTVTQSAEEPWLAAFNLSFVAWKERFRNSSPYQNQIKNEVPRGHAYPAWQPTAVSTLNGVPANARQQFNLLPPNKPTPQVFPNPTPPVVVSESQAPDRAFVQDTQVSDQSPPPFQSYFLTTPGMLNGLQFVQPAPKPPQPPTTQPVEGGLDG